MADNDVLTALNERQRDAVTATEGFVRVVAGAGTGKTRTLTHRYAYLVGTLGISPANILCLTFTNKAANEMKKRVRAILGEGSDTALVSTIHAFCSRVLREDIAKLCYPESFLVLDNADRKRILEDVYEELGLRLNVATFRQMMDKLEIYKDTHEYIDWFRADFDIRSLQPISTDEAIIYRYLREQRKYFGLDFNDLLNFCLHIFAHFPEVAEKWQNKLHYVLVDEFQDIVPKEYTFIRTLAEKHGNLFVVGDPDQNIYEWRGARVNLLTDFDQNNRPCQTVILAENYRSTPEILAAANDLIEKNRFRIKKELKATRASDAKPVYFHGKSEKEEADFLIRTIRARLDSGIPGGEIAVLYRSNYLSRFLEQALTAAKIPYVIYGGVAFYERAEIKDVLSYLRLIVTGDDLSFLRVVNFPRRKIGKTKIAWLRQLAEERKKSLCEVFLDVAEEPFLAGTGARRFAQVIRDLRAQKTECGVSELTQRILHESGYEEYIRRSGDIERLDNIAELLRSMMQTEQDFGEPLTPDTYLQSVTLSRDSDAETENSKIKLMTVHTAKGLEFDTVFICGLYDGVFPSSRALEERRGEALEEERRLFFVAMTRAENRLYLTESDGAGLQGASKMPSRFLFDMDDSLLEYLGSVPPSAQTHREAEPEVAAKRRFSVGDGVMHAVFGAGVIAATDDSILTYTVDFNGNYKPIRYDFEGLLPR